MTAVNPPRRSRTIAAAIGVIGALVLSACGSAGGSAGSGNGGDGGTLTIGNALPPFSIDPAQSGNGRAGTFLQPAYEPLIRTAADGEFQEALASEWSLSDDNRVATFTLRDDASFSDGEPVTAEAAKASIEYYAQANGPFAQNLADLQSVDVVDEQTFTVTMNSGNPNLLSLFDTYNLAGDLISPTGLADPEALGTQTFGAGPYVLDSATTVASRNYVYVPNEHYYDQDAIVWDRVVINVYEDQNSAVQALRSGQADVLVSDPLTANANVGSLEERLSIVSAPVQWTGMLFDDRGGDIVPALGDERVRQAINFALDREAITEALFGDFGTPTVQPQTEGQQGYDPTLEEVYPYDPERARALIEEAGYADGVTIPLAYAVSTINTTLAQVLTNQLGEVGITLDLIETQNLPELQDMQASRQSAAILMQLNGAPPFLASLQLIDTGSRFNFYGYEDPEVTALLEAASALPAEEADEAWQTVYRALVEKAWFAPTSASATVYFQNDRVTLPELGLSTIIDVALITPAD